MLRGLLLRKAFLLMDLALVLLLLVTAYLAFDAIFQDAVAIGTPPPPDTLPELEVAKVGALSEYEVIKENGLFGSAAAERRPDEVVEAPTEPTVEVTRLPLKLLGTASTSPTDVLGSAGIKNTQTNVEDTYYIGEPVLSDVILEEVHKREVVLFNKKENKREILSMDEKEEPASLRVASASGRRPAPAASPEDQSTVVIKRNEIMEVASDMGRLVGELRPGLAKDDKDNIIGITSPVLGQVPLAKKAGLADNDVITAINGISIDSVEKVSEIAEKFKNLNVFHLKVLRNGQTVTRTIKLE